MQVHHIHDRKVPPKDLMNWYALLVYHQQHQRSDIRKEEFHEQGGPILGALCLDEVNKYSQEVLI